MVSQVKRRYFWCSCIRRELIKDSLPSVSSNTWGRRQKWPQVYPCPWVDTPLHSWFRLASRWDWALSADLLWLLWNKQRLKNTCTVGLSFFCCFWNLVTATHLEKPGLASGDEGHMALLPSSSPQQPAHNRTCAQHHYISESFVLRL